MFREDFPAFMLSYPEPAPGWRNGVYYERKGERSALTARVFSKKENGVLITSKMWTETEDTGFGIYPYVNSPAFSLNTGLKDVRINVTVSNPSDTGLKLSCYANNILKLNSETLLPGEAIHTFSFTLCSVEEETILQLFVPSDARNYDDAAEQQILVNDISFDQLEAKKPGTKPVIFLASDSTVQSYDRFHYPQTGWGQVLYRFFNDGNPTEELMSPDMMYPQNHIYETPFVTIENRSIGARSSRSFINEGKWDMLLSRALPGDYCFIQWGHNDATAVRPNRYVAPSDFAWWLKKYVA